MLCSINGCAPTMWMRGFAYRSRPPCSTRCHITVHVMDLSQTQVCVQVVSVAATFCEVWEGVTSLIAEVDVLAGFAELATSAPVAYVRPNMLPSDAGEIKLIGCRCLLSPGHTS